jgi:hypothetical protein
MDIQDFFKKLDENNIKRNTKQADEFYQTWLKEGTELPKRNEVKPPETVKDYFDKHYDLISMFDEDMQVQIIKTIESHLNTK